jgi:hypothetical protein
MTKHKRSREGGNAVSGFSMKDKDVFALLSRCERLQVTREELEQFDDSSFDAESEKLTNKKLTPSKLLANLDELQASDECREDQDRAIDVQGVLFAAEQSAPSESGGSKYHFEVTPQRFNSLVPAVIQAFNDIRVGWSADYVILHPERNLEFLKQCWRLGIAATPEELNWTLMNARKNGKLSGCYSVNRYSIAKRELDQFSFAAEMALRELQDKAWVEEHRESLSLDKLLCSPRLAVRFDELARSIAPGRPSLEYRWAAMTLRKARRLAQNAFPIPLFEDNGLLEDLRPSRVPTETGVYWIWFEDRSAFVGVADSLRIQLDSFVGTLGVAAVPTWIQDRPMGKPRLRYLATPNAKLDERERVRSAVFQRNGSRLNFKDSSLFSAYVVA